jgi:hypothetical protein
MVITIKELKNIRFPVYRLPHSEWTKSDGLLFFEGLILDDKNMSGDSLGLRRLQTPFYKSLFPLRKSIHTTNGIFKQSTKCFIDSNGVPFIYMKTVTGQLKYYKIESVTKKITGSLLKLKGIPKPFSIPRPPATEMKWAGVLHYHGFPWVLYEYSETKLPDTRRKI